MNLFNKITNFVREVKQELGKVSWSSREELMGATTVVITITAILTAFIGAIDLVLSSALSRMFK